MLCETQKTRPDLLKRAHAIFTNLGMHIREIDPASMTEILLTYHTFHISPHLCSEKLLWKRKLMSKTYSIWLVVVSPQQFVWQRARRNVDANLSTKQTQRN